MWTVAVYDLGISDADFWDLSFWQLTALIDRHVQAERRIDERFAVLDCIIANSNRDSKKKPAPFTVQDFMPQPAKKRVAQSWQSMHAQLLNWRAGFRAQQKKVTQAVVDGEKIKKTTSIVRRPRGK